MERRSRPVIHKHWGFHGGSTTMTPTPEHGAVIKQAVEWHQRLKLGELDLPSQRAFRAWIEQSPQHLKELTGLCLLDVLLQGGPLQSNVLRALPTNVINLESYAPAARSRAQEQMAPKVTRRFAVKKLAVAAGLTVALFAASFVRWVSGDQAIVTAQGRWDKDLLEDGTVVQAGPGTELRIHFDDERRLVTLVRGEALFEVAKDPDRPFVVSTDAGTVRAVGTEFATHDLGDTVVVTVAEGIVAVAPSAGGNRAQPSVRVTANQQVVLSPKGVSVPVVVDVDRELKWIRNWYEFHGESVGEIVAELNLRHHVRVVIDDPEVARLRLSPLSFKPSQPQDFVARINGWNAGRPRIDRQPREDVLHIEQP